MLPVVDRFNSDSNYFPALSVKSLHGVCAHVLSYFFEHQHATSGLLKWHVLFWLCDQLVESFH